MADRVAITGWEPWNLWCVSGPLDVRRLAGAIDLVTRSTDVLRPPHTDGPGFVPGEENRIVLDVLDTDSPLRDGRIAPEIARKLAPLLFDGIDLRHQPAGRACLVQGDHDEHLLALSFDHTMLDGWSLGLLTRAIAACYETGDYEPHGPSFRDFVLSQPDLAAQDANLAAWKELLAGHPIPGPPLRFPGGVTKDAFLIDGYYDATFPPAMAEDLTAAAEHTGLSRAEMLAATTALAVDSWSDGPQAMLGVRHGYTRAEDIPVIGPSRRPT